LKHELTKFMNPGSDICEQVEINAGNISSHKFNGKGSVRHLNDVKKEKIINTIQEDKALWTKILKFTKIELKEVKEVLNKKGYIVENEILKNYLSELGVIFYQ
jgi:hypothetical protein